MIAFSVVVIVVGLVLAVLLQRMRTGPHDPFVAVGQALSLLGVVAAGLGLFAFRQAGVGDTKLTSIEGDEIVDMDLNQPLGDFEFVLAEGGATAHFSDYQGKVILLNVWATWCAPCLTEIPALNKVQNDFEEEGLIVLSLSDEPKEDLEAFSNTLRLETVSGIVEDPSVLPPVLKSGFDLRPTTLLIDRDGNVRKYMLGDRDYAFFSRVVQEYL